MSLVPMLFSDSWEDIDHLHSLFNHRFSVYPHSLSNHRFSVYPEDLIADRDISLSPLRLRYKSNRYHPFMTSLAKRKERGASTLSADKDKFQVTLDVQQFAPDEINVKVVDKTIVVEAKHEEKEDEHGWISRQFTRKYLVPNQCDIDKVETQLSSDGIMTIIAPRKEVPKVTNEKEIKIQYTGQPAINNIDKSNNPKQAQNQPQTPVREPSQRQSVKKTK